MTDQPEPPMPPEPPTFGWHEGPPEKLLAGMQVCYGPPECEQHAVLGDLIAHPDGNQAVIYESTYEQEFVLADVNRWRWFDRGPA